MPPFGEHGSMPRRDPYRGRDYGASRAGEPSYSAVAIRLANVPRLSLGYQLIHHALALEKHTNKHSDISCFNNSVLDSYLVWVGPGENMWCTTESKI